MSSPDLILDALRARLRAAGITYKLLAERIGVSESSVKRMFGQKDMALSRLAEIAFSVNERTENIGARRLYTVMEKLLEVISFSAGAEKDQPLRIDAAYVNERLEALAVNEDLSRYVL